MALLGPVGGVLALLGVVVLPISTGDTAFRSARLLVADTFSISQQTTNSRVLALPIFLAGIALTFVDFSVIWRYFGWANQTMSCVTLWSISVYLARRGRQHWISTIPALFMTAVCTSYLCYAKIGFGLPLPLATGMGIALSLGLLWIFLKRRWTLPESEKSC